MHSCCGGVGPYHEPPAASAWGALASTGCVCGGHLAGVGYTGGGGATSAVEAAFFFSRGGSCQDGAPSGGHGAAAVRAAGVAAQDGGRGWALARGWGRSRASGAGWRSWSVTPCAASGAGWRWWRLPPRAASAAGCGGGGGSRRVRPAPQGGGGGGSRRLRPAARGGCRWWRPAPCACAPPRWVRRRPALGGRNQGSRPRAGGACAVAQIDVRNMVALWKKDARVLARAQQRYGGASMHSEIS